MAGLALLELTAAPRVAHATPPVVKVSGRVASTDGHALEAAQVRLIELDRSTTTNADGAYAFTAVSPGVYTLSIAMIAYAPETRRITVADSDITADFTLKPSAIELTPVQVTASATATSTFNSPQPTTVVDADALRTAQAANLGETLAGTPGVHSLSTGVGIGKPVIRGLTSNRVLVLDDGQRLETQQWGDEHSPNIEVAGVERIEVIRGPASVLYGSDALGGVINVIPAPLPDAIGRRPFAQGSLSTAYQTNNHQPDGTVTVAGASGGFGARASVTGRSSADVRTPAYVLWNSGNEAASGNGAIGYRGTWGAASASYSYRGERIELTDEDSTATPYQRIQEQRGRVNLSLPMRAGRFEFTGGYEQNRRREFEDAASADVALGLLSHSYLGEVHYHHPPLGRMSGLVGLSAYRTTFEKFGEETLIPNTTADNVGVYVFEQADAGPWTFSAGGRFDYRHLDVSDDAALGVTAQTRTYNSVTGNVGVLYHVSAPVALVLNVGRGFRAPSSFDLFANGVHEGTVAFERGNPDLTTESSLNTDLALRVQSRAVSLEVGGFVNVVNDFIFTVPSGEVDAASGFQIYDVTQGDARLTGFESAFAFHPTAYLHLQATADYVVGQNTTTDEPLPSIPPFRATYTARFEGGQFGALRECYFSLGGESNAKQTRLDPSEAQFYATAFDGAGYQSQAYTLLNLGAGFVLPLGQRGMHLDLSLRNVLNQRYADYLSRIKTNALDPGQGRNVIARVTWEY
jgi:iron complex outermembrane receptor protein